MTAYARHVVIFRYLDDHFIMGIDAATLELTGAIIPVVCIYPVNACVAESCVVYWWNDVYEVCCEDNIVDHTHCI